jgi:hypothetical protein
MSTLRFFEHSAAPLDLHLIKKQIFDRLTEWFGTCRPENTIIVAGAPRSGTTWLAELIRELPRYKMINEPLRLSTNPRARRAGFDWRTRVAPREARPKLEQHLRDILQGRVELGPAWHFQSTHGLGKLISHLANDRAVVKLCRAGRMLHWIHRVSSVRNSVSIVRHPCAVVASMLKMGNNWQPPDDYEATRLVESAPDYLPDHIGRRLQSLPDKCSCWVGHLALQWSLDHYFALHHDAEGSFPWVLTTYEELLSNGEHELNRILGSWDFRLTAAMRDRFRTPSEFASDTLRVDKIQTQLTKWKRELSPAQTDAILDVARAFDLSIYGDSPYPETDELEGFRNREPAHTHRS